MIICQQVFPCCRLRLGYAPWVCQTPFGTFRLPLPFDPGSEAVPFQGVTFRSRRRSVVSLLVGICSVRLLLGKGASVVACLDVALGWAPSLAA